VVGREIASANGFTYSDALKGIEGQWDLEHLSAFLENPQGYAPGTKMSFAGLPKAEDRVNVIAYLNEADGSPVELAPESTAAAPAPASDAASETAPAAAEPAPASEGTGQAAQAEAAAPAPAAEPAPAAAPAADGEYAALLANASAENGQKVFRKCQACHTLEEGKHRVGPSLWGVVGREAGAAEGFNYSDAMKAFEGSWTLSNLDAYLADPAGFVPGNKMTFAGLKDPQDRIDVITHINEADGSPEPLN
jgi:cytochrome c2